MATMPRTTNREPWDLAMAFAEMLNQQAKEDTRAQRQLDTLPLEEAIKQRQLQFASQLQTNEYGQRLAMSEPYDIRKEERTTNREIARENRVASRAKELDTFKTDENIRQSDEIDRRKTERNLEIYKKYPQYFESLRRGSRTAASTSKPDLSYGGNVAMFGSQMEAEMFTEDNPEYELSKVPYVNPSTGKTAFVAKKKGFNFDPSSPPARNAPQVQSKGGTAAAPGEEGGPSTKGDMGGTPSITKENFEERFKGGFPEEKRSDLGFNPLRTVAQAPDRLQQLFLAASEATGVHPDLIAATAYQESGWKPGAYSPAGAGGIMQFMPGTAKEVGINRWNPTEAIIGGAEYIRQGLEKYNGNVGLALARYNAGERNVERYLKTGRIPKETSNYVKSITGYSIDDWVNGNVPAAKQVDTKNNEDEDPLFWVS